MSAPWGKGPRVIVSAAQCPGLVTGGSVNVGQSELNSHHFHPPAGEKTIPWNKIANQIFNSPVKPCPLPTPSSSPWSFVPRPSVLPITAWEPLVPSPTTHCLPQCAPGCWAPHTWDAVLPHVALPLAVPLPIASPPLCHQTNSSLSYWTHVAGEAISEPPGHFEWYSFSVSLHPRACHLILQSSG